MPDDASQNGGSAPKGSGDRAVILGELPEQKGVAILRQRSDDAPVEAGVLRTVREGEPIVGELVSLTRTAADSPVCDVKVHVDARPPVAEGRHKGPPRITSEAFRSGWDALFAPDGPEPPTSDKRLLN